MREKFIYTKPETKERPLTRVEQLFINLKEQYKTQVKALYEVGVLELMADGKNVGYVDYKGQEKPLPSYDEIIARMESQYELLEKKFKQGFTQLNLTAQLIPLSFLTDRVRDEILKAKKERRLKSTSGEELELYEKQPLYINDEYKDVDTNGSLVYFPTQYTEKDHGGLTKEELEGDERLLNGFLISLTEDQPDLPSQGKGKTVEGRKQLEANMTPEQYLKLLQTDPQYFKESGQTPEQWLTYFMTNLKQGRVVDDYQGKGKVNWNLAGFFKGSGLVSLSDWYRYNQEARLYGDHQSERHDYYGFRSSVNI